MKGKRDATEKLRRYQKQERTFAMKFQSFNESKTPNTIHPNLVLLVFPLAIIVAIQRTKMYAIKHKAGRTRAIILPAHTRIVPSLKLII